MGYSISLKTKEMYGSLLEIVLILMWCIGGLDGGRCCELSSPFWQHTMHQQQPVLIGHRGAPGHRPEHTLASYELAIDLGADYIELDLVPTKDHVLIVRHENEISTTTDVASHAEFANRQKTKEIDGAQITGWFTEDFTLEEIKTLRVKERIPNVRPQNTAFDGLYEIPTLEEAVKLARKHNVGLYPETKHPAHFSSIGLPLEEKLVDALHANGYVNSEDKVFIQSFEVESLKKMQNLTKLPLIQLIRDSQPDTHNVSVNATVLFGMPSSEDMAEIATYAHGIGPDKALIFIQQQSDSKTSYQPSPLVENAHKFNLLIHTWTFRNENEFLPECYRVGNSSMPDYHLSLGNSPAEYCDYFCVGVDGLFTDNVSTAAAVRAKIFNPCKSV